MRFYMAGHALIQKGTEYLVMRRVKTNKYMPGKWDIPGGIVRPGETMEEAILREVYEETKLSVKIGPVVHIYANRDQVPKRQTFQAVYLASYISGEIRLNPSEHDMFQWLSYSDIGATDGIDFLLDLIKSFSPS